MVKTKGKVSKILWLSPNKFVFESPFEIDFGADGFCELGVSGKKKILILAERNKPLRALSAKDYMADPLCWFCIYGISQQLLNREDTPRCLLGKECGWVRFCEEFIPGPNFGENKERDVGERRIMAEKLLSKMKLENCRYCQLAEYIQSLKLAENE